MDGAYVVRWNVSMSCGVSLGDRRFAANESAFRFRMVSWVLKSPSGERYTPRILLAWFSSHRLIVVLGRSSRPCVFSWSGAASGEMGVVVGLPFIQRQ